MQSNSKIAVKNSKKPLNDFALETAADSGRSSELTGLLFMLASITLLIFFIIKPSESRWLGFIYGILYRLKTYFGVTMYFLSFLLWYFGIQKFAHGALIKKNIEYFGYVFLLFFSNIFFEIINGTGGAFGKFFMSSFVVVAGNAGTLLISIFGCLVGVSIAFDILLAPLFVSAASSIYAASASLVRLIIYSASFVLTFAFGGVAFVFKASFNYLKNAFATDETDVSTPGANEIEKMEVFKSEISSAAAPISQEPSNYKPESLEEKLFANLKGDASPSVPFKNQIEDSDAENITIKIDSVEKLQAISKTESAAQEAPAASVKAPENLTAGSGSDSINLESVPITRSYEAPHGAPGPLDVEEAENKLFKDFYSSSREKKLQKSEPQSNTAYENYKYPDFKAILRPAEKIEGISEEELKANAEKLVTTLKNFNVEVKIAHITCGPTVTRYELQPASGVKVSKIVGLADDIALALATTSLRMEAPIPGKAAIGVEVPNTKPVPVYFSELITLPEFNESRSPLLFALGKTITGQPIIADLRNMPHLLVAGTTGSGKSVCINTIIASILFHARPDEVKFVMVDPKMVELTGYNEIPHLIHPVLVKVKDVPFLLEWGVYEMERRYRLLSAFGVRAIDGFNQLVERYNGGEYELADREAEELLEQGIDELEKLPYLVFVIDELADIMMTDKSNKVEEYICRLAQMARAVGIHLIVATQRPSVNVITGLIKANLPSRIAFAVSSVTDSRTILDAKGAEKLIGRGDMLYFPTGLQKPVRVQGAYVRDEEIKKLTDFLKMNYSADYKKDVEEKIAEYQSAKEDGSTVGDERDSGEVDDIFFDAVRLVVENKMGSASMLQRVLKIGHNRALKLIDRMERIGVVGPFEDKKPRKVLWSMQDYEQNVKKVA